MNSLTGIENYGYYFVSSSLYDIFFFSSIHQHQNVKLLESVILEIFCPRKQNKEIWQESIDFGKEIIEIRNPRFCSG